MRFSKCISEVTGFVFFFMLVFAANLFSQSKDQINLSIIQIDQRLNNENVSKNLAIGLKNENDGVRMSAVAFVGKYNLSQFEPTLIEMLESENSKVNKEKIALALYQIGKFNGMAAIEVLSYSCSDKELKLFYENLLEKFREDLLEKDVNINRIVKNGNGK